jgi:hypothetical protein
MNAIDRDALLKWLGEQYYREDISHDHARAFLLVRRKIESGCFDAPNEAEERYRESIEGIRRIIQSASYKTFEGLKSVLLSAEWACNEALSTTEPTGAERVRNDDFLGEKINEKCPKCGANLLGNKVGDKWCSLVGCDYSLNAPEGAES